MAKFYETINQPFLYSAPEIPVVVTWQKEFCGKLRVILLRCKALARGLPVTFIRKRSRL